MATTCNAALGTAVIGETLVPITCGKASGHDTAPGATTDQKAHGDPIYGVAAPPLPVHNPRTQ